MVALPPRGYRYSVATSSLDVATANRQGFISTRSSGVKATRAEAWDTITSIMRDIAMEDGV